MVLDLPRTIELDDDRTITIRAMQRDDLEALIALFERLPLQDLEYRFFTGHAPPKNVIERWTTTCERGGVGIVAVLDDDDDGRRVIGEAGYELLPNGDGEFAITVAPDQRGWLGPYLLAVLRDAAAERGVPNLEADVSCSNRRMIALLRHHGYVVLDHDGGREMKVAVASSGRVPTWPGEHDRPRILVEPTSRWRLEQEARDADLQVVCCPGPERGGPHPCPLLIGEPCPLIEGADVVLVKTNGRTDIGERLLHTHEERETGPPHVHETEEHLPSDASPEEIIARLRDVIDLTEPPGPEPHPVR